MRQPLLDKTLAAIILATFCMAVLLINWLEKKTSKLFK